MTDFQKNENVLSLLFIVNRIFAPFLWVLLLSMPSVCILCRYNAIGFFCVQEIQHSLLYLIFRDTQACAFLQGNEHQVAKYSVTVRHFKVWKAKSEDKYRLQEQTKKIDPCKVVIEQKNVLICIISLGGWVFTRLSSLWHVLDYTI